MTNKQLKQSTIVDLLEQLKQKGVCFHSQNQTQSIFNELSIRVDNSELQNIKLGLFHLRNNEPIDEFIDECNKLIKRYSLQNCK